MNAQNKLRVACVGAGYFSQFHYDSWKRMQDVDLVASCNRDIEKARATGLPAYDDLETMLSKTQPDLLDVILPPVAHVQTMRKAIARGIRWFICQKPFCQNLTEAERIVSEASEAGTVIIVHENFRFQPWYRVIKAALDDGLVGDILQVTFRFRPGDGQGPRAYLDRQPYFQTMPKFLVHETAVHWIDTFRFLLGDPKSVYADLRKINPVIAGEDAGYIVFEYDKGVRALFDGNRCLDHAADNLRRTMGEGLFEGTKGSIKLRGDGSVTLRDFETVEEKTLLPADHWKGFGGDCVHALQSHVVSGILTGTRIENRAEDYLKIVSIEEAIYASSKTGTKIMIE